ncbi:MAG: DUF3592 domain-containing protein [Candidatus Altimarinota bacterium]
MKIFWSSRVDFNDPKSVAKFPWKLFLLMGIGIPMLFVFVGARMLYWDYYRFTHWVDTPGTITFSEVSSYRGDGTMMYTPDIRYHYLVGEEQYDGFVNMTSSSWRSSSDETVAEYTVGKDVMVKVNPENPTESYLPIPDVILPVIFIVIGVVAALIFTSVTVYGMRKKQAYLLQQRSSEIPGSSS